MEQKEKILLIAGCSHAAGHEIDGRGDSHYNRNHSFGNLLAEKMGYRPINAAIGGMSNSGIVRTVQGWIHNNYDPDKHELFVLICWTESARIDIPAQHRLDYRGNNAKVDWYPAYHSNYMQVNTGWTGTTKEEQDFLAPIQEFQINNLSFLEILSANLALQMQYMCKSMGINYLMCNTMHQFLPSVWLAPYLAMIDREHYIDFDDPDLSFYWYYRKQGYSNPKAQYWHHDEIPHQLYAEKLFGFISPGI